MPVGFTSDIRKEDVSDEELRREKMKLHYEFSKLWDEFSEIRRTRGFRCVKCGKDVSYEVYQKMEKEKVLDKNPIICKQCQKGVESMWTPLLHSETPVGSPSDKPTFIERINNITVPQLFLIIIIIWIIVMPIAFILDSMDEDESSYYFPDSGSDTIRILLENKCSHEIHVQVWVNGDYYGSQYLGTGFLSEVGGVQTDIPAGSSIKIRVKSTSYPWHDASTPYFESTSRPLIILHQDGSVTYIP